MRQILADVLIVIVMVAVCYATFLYLLSVAP